MPKGCESHAPISYLSVVHGNASLNYVFISTEKNDKTLIFSWSYIWWSTRFNNTLFAIFLWVRWIYKLWAFGLCGNTSLPVDCLDLLFHFISIFIAEEKLYLCHNSISL